MEVVVEVVVHVVRLVQTAVAVGWGKIRTAGIAALRSDASAVGRVAQNQRQMVASAARQRCYAFAGPSYSVIESWRDSCDAVAAAWADVVRGVHRVHVAVVGRGALHAVDVDGVAGAVVAVVETEAVVVERTKRVAVDEASDAVLHDADALSVGWPLAGLANTIRVEEIVERILVPAGLI